MAYEKDMKIGLPEILAKVMMSLYEGAETQVKS